MAAELPGPEIRRKRTPDVRKVGLWQDGESKWGIETGTPRYLSAKTMATRKPMILHIALKFALLLKGDLGQ